jgi:hypothetical protein
VNNPAPADLTTWLPDLTGTSLTDLRDWEPGEAAGEMLDRVARPSSQLAGSSGS